jgi:hypothetical protein
VDTGAAWAGVCVAGADGAGSNVKVGEGGSVEVAGGLVGIAGATVGGLQLTCTVALPVVLPATAVTVATPPWFAGAV